MLKLQRVTKSYKELQKIAKNASSDTILSACKAYDLHGIPLITITAHGRSFRIKPALAKGNYAHGMICQNITSPPRLRVGSGHPTINLPLPYTSSRYLGPRAPLRAPLRIPYTHTYTEIRLQ